MIVEFKLALAEKLKQSARNLIMDTGSGGAGSFEDYRYRVGITTGLKRALALVEETYQTFMHDEDDSNP